MWRRIRSLVISLGVGLVFSFVLGLVGASGARAGPVALWGAHEGEVVNAAWGSLVVEPPG